MERGARPRRPEALGLLTFIQTFMATKKAGLYANIAAKRKRIENGSGETMRKKGAYGAPEAGAFRRAAKTATKR
jgi:hypothetical protein